MIKTKKLLRREDLLRDLINLFFEEECYLGLECGWLFLNV